MHEYPLCVWSKILMIASFWEATSLSMYSYIYIKKYDIWNRYRSGIKSLKSSIVQKTNLKTCNLNKTKIFSKHLSPSGMHCEHDYILSQYPFSADFQQLSETICQLICLGLGFKFSAKARSKCLRDNRCSEVYGARWDTSKPAEGAGGGDH